MRIKRIYLGDFGIFQNQTMGQIEHGLVVVAGPNRAGKTTLMTALRCLGYGIPKGRGIPPAAGQYEIRADVESEGHAYSIFVNGHGNPRLEAKAQAPEIMIESLYNNLDRFTYSQIFTISLDELRQVPDNLGSGDQDRIGAVLLGAGWSDALRLIQLRDSTNKKASEIGGKSGSIHTKKFQPHYDQLCVALELRDRANVQMDEYEVKCSRLEDVGNVLIPSREKSIEATKNELQLLELIRDRYPKYQTFKLNKRLLEKEGNRRLLETYPHGGMAQAQSLKEHYETALSKEKTARENFYSFTGHDDGSTLQSGLLEAAGTLDTYAMRVSGWEARIGALHDSREELEHSNDELRADLKELFGAAAEKGELIIVNSVQADQINAQELQHTASLYNDLEHELKRKESELADLKGELAQKITQAKSLPPADGGLMWRVGWLIGADMLATVGLSLILPAGVAITVGLAGAACILAYFLKQNGSEQVKAKQLADLEKEISDRQTRKVALTKRREEITGKIEQMNNSITRLKEDYNIPTAVDVAFLPDFVQRIRGLQRVHDQICAREKKLAQAEVELENELAPLISTLKALPLPGEDYDHVMRNWATIFRHLETCITYANKARELQRAANDIEAVEENILQLLAAEDASVPAVPAGQSLLFLLQEFIMRGHKYEELTKIWFENDTLRQVLVSDLDTQRWRQLLLGDHDRDGVTTDDLLSAFATWCEAFQSVAEIEAKHRAMETEIISLEKELQQLREEKRDLLKETDELASDRKLLEAKTQIDAAKNELSSILEKYAVHRIGAFMLERVQEKLLEKTRDSLLAPASEIFSGITDNRYGNIDLPSGKEQGAFQARLSDGNEQAIHALSRATREQLFFSMRLSRIRDIKPELPVILDDTFANYDLMHTRETVKCLTALAQTHQVFVLTCHPELLACLHEYGSAACQYWGMQEGRLTGPYHTFSEVNKLLLQG